MVFLFSFLCQMKYRSRVGLAITCGGSAVGAGLVTFVRWVLLFSSLKSFLRLSFVSRSSFVRLLEIAMSKITE